MSYAVGALIQYGLFGESLGIKLYRLFEIELEERTTLWSASPHRDRAHLDMII